MPFYPPIRNWKWQQGRHSAELFGFDFMVDSDYRVWLIEVNTNPFLGTKNQWHGKLVSDMIEGFTQLVIDPMFPPPKNNPPEINVELVQDWNFKIAKTHLLESTLLPNSKRNWVVWMVLPTTST